MVEYKGFFGDFVMHSGALKMHMLEIVKGADNVNKYATAPLIKMVMKL